MQGDIGEWFRKKLGSGKEEHDRLVSMKKYDAKVRKATTQAKRPRPIKMKNVERVARNALFGSSYYELTPTSDRRNPYEGFPEFYPPPKRRKR